MANNTIIRFFQNQLNAEAPLTRAILKLVPADKFDWQPHRKSMTLRQLSTHVAEIPGWVQLAIDLNVLDVQKDNHQPESFKTNQDVLDYFELKLAAGVKALKNASDGILDDSWEMRSGEKLFFSSKRGDVIRMSLSQLIHHRAQLGVYLRLLNIPIPGVYGPSADDLEKEASVKQ